MSQSNAGGGSGKANPLRPFSSLESGGVGSNSWSLDGLLKSPKPALEFDSDDYNENRDSDSCGGERKSDFAARALRLTPSGPHFESIIEENKGDAEDASDY